MNPDYTPVVPTILKIGGRRYVAGLYWQALTKPRAPLAEARKIGKREGKDVVSIRRAETVVQAGFMTRGSHNVKGLYSLATVLAQSISARVNADQGRPSDKSKHAKHGATFLSAFAIGDNQYAMLAVKGGGILADSDMVGDLNAVSANLHRFWSLIDSPECPVFAPPECEFGGIELSLEEMVANPKGHHQLKPLSRMPSGHELLNICLALGCVCVAGVWVFDWYSAREAQKAAQAAAEAAELRRLAAESGKATAAQALVKPWVKAPAVGLFTSVCEGAIRIFPLSMGGWTLEQASCGADGAHAQYARQPGLTVNQFYAAADAWNSSATRSARIDGEQGGISVPLKMAAAGDEPLSSMARVRERLLSHFQFKLIATTLRPEESKAVLLPGADPQAEQPKPDWETVKFDTHSLQNPTRSLNDLDGTGVRVTRMVAKITSAPGGGSINVDWTLEGEMYGK